MAIKIITNQSITAKAFIEQLYDYLQEGEARTWHITATGNITHSPIQWQNRASFKLSDKCKDCIEFILCWKKSKGMTQEVYDTYHGHFVSFLLVHFGEYISKIEITNNF